MAGESFWLSAIPLKALAAHSPLSLPSLSSCAWAASTPTTTPHCCLQVMVGRNFGSYVTFEEGHYIYFYIAQTGFVVFAA